MAMTEVSIFHNISRDASFGLNTVLRVSEEDPGNESARQLDDGRWSRKEQGTGDERHELVWVFRYRVVHGSAVTPGHLLDEAFAMFNEGTGPVTEDYRRLRLRSLSVGDVVMLGEQAYSCESSGWRQRRLGECRFLPADRAETAIQERYGFGPGEQLSITVPLPD